MGKSIPWSIKTTSFLASQSYCKLNLKELINKYNNAMRVQETVLLSGFFVIGAFFSIDKLSALFLIDVCKIGAIAFFLNSGLYALNAYTGKREDKYNDRLSILKKIPSRNYLTYFLVTTILTLIFSYYFHYRNQHKECPTNPSTHSYQHEWGVRSRDHQVNSDMICDSHTVFHLEITHRMIQSRA